MYTSGTEHARQREQQVQGRDRNMTSTLEEQEGSPCDHNTMKEKENGLDPERSWGHGFSSAGGFGGNMGKYGLQASTWPDFHKKSKLGDGVVLSS